MTLKFKVGDRVQASKIASISLMGIRPGWKGTVTEVLEEYTTYPYRVHFDKDKFPKRMRDVLVAASEIIAIPPSLWQRFLDRWFPARDAEKHFGTSETMEAFQRVQENGKAVNVKGE